MTPPVLVRTRAELATAREGLPGPVVLVPTMGALHRGHRSLLRLARDCAKPGGSVVASIFVNPLQFGPGEDFGRYPRSLGDDLAVCAQEGVTLVFAPGREQMYPGEQRVTVDPGPIGGVLEGEFRPGFFTGVLTVVIKLFGLVRPDVAVFGLKDAQQFALVRQMVTDFDLGIDIRGAPIVRDDDGLATSSRNAYLSPAQRVTALALSAAIGAARARSADGGAGPTEILAAAQKVLDEAAAAGPPIRTDYLALVDPATFQPVAGGHRGHALLAVAARVGSTRLIDNGMLVIGCSPGQDAPAGDGWLGT